MTLCTWSTPWSTKVISRLCLRYTVYTFQRALPSPQNVTGAHGVTPEGGTVECRNCPPALTPRAGHVGCGHCGAARRCCTRSPLPTS